ncbi:UNKNOWN [Stylonychia lemnae]|uniref:Uncharacterized protein n=1 Tax=Stylonychia lemnae TaxID=5949 RepID=A0A078AU75_STYLE|nr:UNKNOWN [Stylonychia lemnae]|eukprot:CDW84383.1 UNKNOWN [Stylonychia lemnae]
MFKEIKKFVEEKQQNFSPKNETKTQLATSNQKMGGGYTKLNQKKQETKKALQFVRDKDGEIIKEKLKEQKKNPPQVQLLQRELEEQLQIIKNLEQREAERQKEFKKKSTLSQKRVIKKQKKEEAKLIQQYLEAPVDLESIRTIDEPMSQKDLLRQKMTSNEKMRSQDINDRSPFKNTEQILQEFNQTQYFRQQIISSPKSPKPDPRELPLKHNFKNQRLESQEQLKSEKQLQEEQQKTQKSEKIRSIIKSTIRNQQSIERDDNQSKIKKSLKEFNQKVREENKLLQKKQQVLDQDEVHYQYDVQIQQKLSFDQQCQLQQEYDNSFQMEKENVRMNSNLNQLNTVTQTNANTNTNSYFNSQLPETKINSPRQYQVIDQLKQTSKINKSEIFQILDDISTTILNNKNNQQSDLRFDYSNRQTKAIEPQTYRYVQEQIIPSSRQRTKVDIDLDNLRAELQNYENQLLIKSPTQVKNEIEIDNFIYSYNQKSQDDDLGNSFKEDRIRSPKMVRFEGIDLDSFDLSSFSKEKYQYKYHDNEYKQERVEATKYDTITDI